jgi:hypothetical protein
VTTYFRTLAICAAGLFAGACSDGAPSGVAGPHPLHPEADKSDNYVSTNAREFVLTGHALVDAPSDLDTLEGDARQAAINAAAERRLPTVVRSVKAHVESVLNPLNEAPTAIGTRRATPRPPPSPASSRIRRPPSSAWI